MDWRESDQGWELSSSRARVFFGKKGFSKTQIGPKFSSKKVCRLKQVHGVRMVSSEEGEVQADGLWTSRKGEALCIQTADCVPVLIAGESRVAAIHLGWRGYAGGLIDQALRFFLAEKKGLQIYIGPAIGFESFEVGLEVVDQILLSGSFSKGGFVRDHQDDEKKYIDLSGLIKATFLEKSSNFEVHHLAKDTFTHPELNSYRASKGGAGRQWSIIQLKGF